MPAEITFLHGRDAGAAGTGRWRVLLVCCVLAAASLSGCSTLRKMKQYQQEQRAGEQSAKQAEQPAVRTGRLVLEKEATEKEATEKQQAAAEAAAEEKTVTEESVTEEAVTEVAAETEVVTEEAEAEAEADEVQIAEVGADDAIQKTAEQEQDRAGQQAVHLQRVIVQSMPLGKLMEYSKQRSRSWPLGPFRHRLQTEQLDCVRTLMNAPAYEQYVLGKARRFVLQNSELVPRAMDILDGGGGRFLQTMSQAVLDRVSGRADKVSDIAGVLSEAEKKQAIALLREPDLQPVRDMVGISRVTNRKTGKTENNYTRRATNTLALLALEQCGVDPRGLLTEQ